MVKNAKNGVIDLDVYRKSLAKVFNINGEDIAYAAVAYQPKKEGLPSQANSQQFEVSVAEIDPSMWGGKTSGEPHDFRHCCVSLHNVRISHTG